MPLGIIVNTASIIFGGVIGTWAGGKLSENFKENMNMIFGCCSMAMGISSIVLMGNMPAVIFSVVIGTAVGLAVRLGDRINNAGKMMQCFMSRFIRHPDTAASKEEYSMLVTAIVLFCASGTGIYGAIVSGITGDHSILIAKSILDLFTAIIFACSLGITVSMIAILQVLIFMVLFLCAGFIFPLTTDEMINDFKACGGVLMLATGFRISKVKMFPTADMIPAMVIVMPVSWLWTSYVLPLIG